jgi:hypothetical protein
VKTFVKEVRRLFNADKENENARKDSLSLNINVKGVHPKSLRTPLKEVDKYYIKAMIPVLRETYVCSYDANDGYKPVYTKINSAWLGEELVFGILTAHSVGHIPPVNIST